jgi:hypothetical protein
MNKFCGAKVNIFFEICKFYIKNIKNVIFFLFFLVYVHFFYYFCTENVMQCLLLYNNLENINKNTQD